MNTYSKSVRIYAEIHNHNKLLSTAYTWSTPTPKVDGFVYPSEAFVEQMKVDLRRLKIGPYRNRPTLADERCAGSVTP